MRIWKAVEPPKDIDPRVYNILKRLNEGVAESGRTINNITNNITNLGTSPDLTNYFYLPGRPGGQVGFGASLTSDAGSVARLVLQAYNNFVGSTSLRSSRFEMSNDIVLRADSVYIVERDLTYSGIQGFQFLTGAGFGSQFNVYGGQIRALANTAGGSPQIVIDNSPSGSSIAAKLLQIKAKSGQTGNLTEWLDNTGAVLSRIKADGTFEGPISATISALFPDNVFRIVGSGDATKQVAFEVDGLTTGTTRTLTVPDVSARLLLHLGAGGTQNIGTAATTGGNTDDIVSSGRLHLGNNPPASWITPGFDNMVLKTNHIIASSIPNPAIFVTQDNQLVGAATNGNWCAFRGDATGGAGYTSGNFSVQGVILNANPSIPAGVTCAELSGMKFTSTIQHLAGGDGNITLMAGVRAQTNGVSTWTGGTLAVAAGMVCELSTRAIPTTLLEGVRIDRGPASPFYTAAITQAVAFDVTSNFAASVNVVTWSGLRIPSISGPGTVWGLDITGTMNNRIAGSLTLGSSATPTTTLDVDGDATIGVAGANTNLFVGVSTVEVVSSTLTIQSGAAQARLRLNRAGTDFVQLNYNGTDTYFDFTGNWFIRTGMNGTIRATMASDGKLRIGDITAPSHWLDLAAGTTTIAPIRFAAGTNLSSPAAGCIEYDGTNFYMSPTALQQKVALMPAVRAMVTFRV